MHVRDVRLQAALMNLGEILVLKVRIDDGREFWLLPGGGQEPDDADDFATVAREVREETGVGVVVRRLLLEVPAHPDDTTYRRYRTFECSLIAGATPHAGARDGIATVRQVRWLRLDDEPSWGAEVVDDRFLAPQLRAIRSALAEAVVQQTTTER